MFEAQVKVQLTRLGSTHPSLAVSRISFACSARGLQTVPTTENWTGAPVWRRHVSRRHGATQAAKAALKDVVGVSDAAFAFGASVFFVAYVLLEIPSNIFMHKVGALKAMPASWQDLFFPEAHGLQGD